MNHSRLVVAVLLLLLLAAIGGTAYSLLRSPGPESGVDPSTSAQPGARAAPDEGSSAVRAQRERDARHEERTALVPEVEAEAAPPQKLTIRVLDAMTKKPVPEATVLAGEIDWGNLGPADSKLAQELQRDRELLLARFGKSYACDARGEAFVPKPKTSALVAARAGPLYAESWIQSNASRAIELLVENDLRLAVQVVDGAKQPLIGVPVQLRASVVKENELWNRAEVKTEAPLGIATFAHLQARVRFTGAPLAAGAAWVARVAVPGVIVESGTFDPRAPPSEPLQIVLPATGSVLISLVDGAGQPVRRGGWCNLRIAGKATDWRDSFGVVIDAEKGTGRAPHVGLGLLLEAIAQVDNISLDAKELAGPVRPREEVEVALVLGNGQPSIVGRAVDGEGEPLPDLSLEVVLAFDQQDYDSSQAKTDKDGRFSAFLRKELIGKRITRLAIRPSVKPQGLFARVAVPRTIVAGPLQLGDVTLSLPPLIVGGTIVDDRGAAVANAQFGVGRKAVLDKGKQPGRGEMLDTWRYDIVSRETEPGRFEVRGYPPEEELRFVCRQYDCLPFDPMPFVRGQGDLRVSMTRGGGIVAKVLVGRELTGVPIRASVRREDLPDAKGITSFETSLGNGTFTCRWRALPPGTYMLSLRVLPDPEPVRTISGIGVQGGADSSDARLDEIDLRGLFRKIEITVVDAEGKPPGRIGFVQVVNAASSSTDRNVQIRGGKAEVWTNHPTVDLLLEVGGYKKRRLDGVGSDTKVVLDKGYAARVRVAGLPAHDGVRVRAELRRDGLASPDLQDVLPWEFQVPEVLGQLGIAGAPGTLDPETGELSFLVSEPGAYRLRVFLEAGDRHKQAVIDEFVPAPLEVRDVAGDQRFSMAFAPGALEQALERVK